MRDKVGQGPYLRRMQVMSTMTYKFLRRMYSARWMDERVVTSEKCWVGIEEKMPEISREVNQMKLVENLTCLNPFEGKIWKINQKVVTDKKSWKTWKSNGKMVMNEELVQNGVMNEELVQNGVTNQKIVKNFVINAKIVPKVEQFANHQSKIVGRIY